MKYIFKKKKPSCMVIEADIALFKSLECHEDVPCSPRITKNRINSVQVNITCS